MNVLMTLTNPFTHDPRVYNEAQSLVKAGHNVTVLGWDRKKANPPKDVNNGINIVRSYNTKFMNLLPYDIFKLHFWWNKGCKDALKLHKQDPFDVVHCHDLNTLPIGIKLKKKLGLPLIYDAHEIWGYMVEKDLPKWWSTYYLRREKKIIRHVDRVITVNEPLKKYFNNITNKPVTIIMNCKPLYNRKYKAPNNDKFTLLFIGSLGHTRFLLELTHVVKKLDDVNCIIGGIGSKSNYVEKLKQKCKESNNIEFIGKVPPDKVVPLTHKCDCVVNMITTKNTNSRMATANKQFEALVCGRPIICTKGTHSAEITKQENCGLVIDWSKEALKKAILKLKDDPHLCIELGRNALKAALREYNWEKQEGKLLSLYSKIVQ